MNIDTLITRLTEHYASLGDGRDARSANEKADWFTASTTAARTLSALRNAPSDLARAQARLADAEAQRAAVLEKQTSLEKEIADAPDWRSFADGRERDREYDRQQNLQRQLVMLHEGTLLRGPSETYARLIDLDARIAELTERRDRAQLQLDGLVQQAEALLAAVPVAG
jgi:hypothetical protein